MYSDRKHSILRLENLDGGLQTKEKILGEEMDYWRRAARTSRILEGRNKIILEKIRVRQANKERMENNILKLYGHCVHENNRWPKRMMTWSPGGRRRRGRLEVKWDKEAERVMKQRHLAFDVTIVATENG